MTQDPSAQTPEIQQTLASEFSLEGRGLHSGAPARALVMPAAATAFK